MFQQLCLNRLSTNGPLCDDVLHIIKSFAFYDIQTAKTIKIVKEIKEIKERIVKRFIHVEASRFRPNGMYRNEDGVEEDSDTSEHWYWSTSVALVFRHDGNYSVFTYEKQFQGINCKICGNYKYTNEYMNVPEKIKCNC